MGTAEQRLRTFKLVDEMVEGGMRRLDALKAIGLSRSTYYDWRGAFQRGGVRALKPRSTRPRTVQRRRWTDADDQTVLKLRGKHPYMDKAKLRTMLAKVGVHLSVSTVGRMLSKAIEDGQIEPASLCEGRPKPKRRGRPPGNKRKAGNARPWTNRQNRGILLRHFWGIFNRY